MTFLTPCRFILISLGLFGGMVEARSLPPVQGSRAVFEIVPDILVQDPPRFGANIETPGMSHWSTEPWHNQWWGYPNPNPVTARVKGTASGGSETTLEDEGNGAKIGFWSVFRNGFFDGGTAVVYRVVNGKMSLVREGRIATYEASKEGPNKLTFAESGPAVMAGDEYVLTTVRTDFPPTVTRTWAETPWSLIGGFLLGPGNPKDLHAAGVRVALSEDAPPGGGGASFALTLPPGWSSGPVSVGNWLLSGQEPDWPRLPEGKPLTVRLWMKLADRPEGMAKVNVGSLGSAEFHVTSEWKGYSFEFIGRPPGNKASERFEIAMDQPGTLLFDNVTIREIDGPAPYSFYPNIVETLKRYRPSTLRIWTLQENKGFGKALDDALGDPEESNMTFRESNGAGTTAHVGLHRVLELCAQVGTDPWIITSTMFSAQEQKNLIEYLAGPADSPYGQKRAAMGRIQPWTDVFGQIKIEMGNETWNSMFSPQGFGGRPAIYGAYSEFMFEQMKSSPWYQADKFQFVVNGFVASKAYGATALRNAPSATGVDIAYYTGGWDAVGLLKAESPEEGWMNVLTYSRRMLVGIAREFKATADAIAVEQGRPGAVQSLVYEAGPGYTLPGPGKFNRAEQEEGKSLAQAINSLDIFMSNLRDGYGDQSFFMFRNGHYWSSHNRNWGEHIAWKALGMRNTLLTGNLITAKTKEMVTINLPETQADVLSQTNSDIKKQKSFPPVPDLPLIDCYAFQDGTRHSFMLISRRLDGSTPTTLELPFDPEPSYSIHTLGGDSPALHNIEEEVVKVVSEEKSGMTKSFTLDVPAHSVVVVVAQAKP